MGQGYKCLGAEQGERTQTSSLDMFDITVSRLLTPQQPEVTQFLAPGRPADILSP